MTTYNELLIDITAIKETHPNIFYMWKTYIELKLLEAEQLKTKCNKMLSICSTVKEPNEKTLIMLNILNI
jgi:hypothetical protein